MFVGRVLDLERPRMVSSSLSAKSAVGDSVYSPPARWAHWIAALLILITFVIGLAMLRIPQGAWQDKLFDWHRSVGTTVLALAALRLLWRLWHPAPDLPGGMPPWMKVSGRANHWLLYILMLALPIIGWLGSSAFGAPVRIYGLFDLPPLVKPHRPLADGVLLMHRLGAFTLAGLVGLHVVAALYHVFIRRDGVFRRMVG
jgi:cytochrome b561